MVEEPATSSPTPSARLVGPLAEPTGPDALAHIWDINAPARLAELRHNKDEAYRALVKHVLTTLGENVPSPATVLDVGSGLGSLTSSIHSSGYTVIGIDPSSVSTEMARKEHPGIPFRTESVEAAAAGDPSLGIFDAVVSNMVLHSVADLNGFFAATSRLLAPGGLFLATLPHPAFYLNGKLEIPLDRVAYDLDMGLEIVFRIHGGAPHPAPIPFFQRSISRYTESMWQHNLSNTRIIEVRNIGPGQQYDVLTILAARD